MNENDINYFNKFIELFDDHYIIGARKEAILLDLKDVFSQSNITLTSTDKGVMISGYIFGILYTVDPKSHFNNSKIQH